MQNRNRLFIYFVTSPLVLGYAELGFLGAADKERLGTPMLSGCDDFILFFGHTFKVSATY